MDDFPSTPHPHVRCDSCSATALVWYRRDSTNTLTLCSRHSAMSDTDLVISGYEVIKDYRQKTPDELRRRLLSPPPSLAELLLLDAVRKSF